MMTAEAASRRDATPMVPSSAMPFLMGKAYDPEAEQLSTIRRRNKRDRNRTLGAPGTFPFPPKSNISKENKILKVPLFLDDVHIPESSITTYVDLPKPPRISKSRSKSRSPGRSIESSSGGGRTKSHQSSRGNSPDNISESSASFHENELIQPAHFRPLPPHSVGSIHQGSSSSSASNNPWMPQYANRDSVRESWISSGSSDHPYLVHHQYHHHYHHQKVPQVSSGGTSDASNKSLASSGGGGGGGGGHQTLVHRSLHGQPSRMAAGTMPKGTKVVSTSMATLPRSAKAGNHPHKHVHHHHHHQQPRHTQPPNQPSLMAAAVGMGGVDRGGAGGIIHPHHHHAGRSGSRESGSSSSRTVSRSGSRSALSKSGSRSGSSSALQRARPATPEGKISDPLGCAFDVYVVRRLLLYANIEATTAQKKK